jgi:hypothetical protein
LKDNADSLPDGFQVVLLDGKSINPDAAVAAKDAVEVKEKGGFAGAVRADESDLLTLENVECDAAKGDGAIRISEMERFDFDYFLHAH